MPLPLFWRCRSSRQGRLKRSKEKENTMSVLAEVSIMPVGVGESISKHVAQAVEVIAASGLNYELCPME